MARHKANPAPAALANATTNTTAVQANPAPAALAVPTGFLPIEYIGKRASHTDGLYGTRIFWEAIGVVKLVPEDVARKMTAINKDVYRGGVYGGESAPGVQAEKPVEDNARIELDMVIQTMDKDALESYAHTHFGQELDKRRSVENLRQEVGRMLDQFGAP